ncbi:MAG: SDR family oxidoreductase [Anaerolineae bacterium]|nr:SDR family oxidoreductase [Anaerolineae bacterium]
MIIANGILTRQSLAGEVVIVTGGGHGIGYEAARALAWLGAQVVIAEIDKQAGKEAVANLNRELGQNSITFIHTDVADESSVNHLAHEALRSYGKVDVVLNNATIAPLGAVQELPIAQWDASYGVNLRGPVLLARTFLPGMIQRQHGVFACVSSTGVAYMGAYEILKTAQVELANTLEVELEGTGVKVFTVGPGMVLTDTAQAGVSYLAQRQGQSVDEFYDIVKDQIISVEVAGAGFAAAIALAERFHGQEISSVAALFTAGIEVAKQEKVSTQPTMTVEQLEEVGTLSHKVHETLAVQAEGWQQRSFFEKQWVIRDFKKVAGMPVERWLEILAQLERSAEQKDSPALLSGRVPLTMLSEYYIHLQELAKGYVKDPEQLEQQLQTVQEWQHDVESLTTLLTTNGTQQLE